MADEFIDPSRIEAAKEIAVAEDGPRRRLSGVQGLVASSLAVAMSLLFMYWAWAWVTTQILPCLFTRADLSSLSPQTEGSIHWRLLVRLAAHRIEFARHRLPAMGL